jgi:hypothetical protein
MTDTSMLLQRLQRMCMVRSVDVLPRGHVRIETGFTYPDGGSVDVFVVKGAKILQTSTALLSDLGQTDQERLGRKVGNRPRICSVRA